MEYSLNFHQETTQMVRVSRPNDHTCSKQFLPSQLNKKYLDRKPPNLVTLSTGLAVAVCAQLLSSTVQFSCTMEDYSFKCAYLQFNLHLTV